MKKTYTIFSDTEKKNSLYKTLNKYTEQNVKNMYKVTQNWIACFIKHAAHIKIKLNEKNA